VRFERILLHRAWPPIVVVATLGIVLATLALRAAPASPVFAGCYGPEVGPRAAAAPDGVFRWTKRTAAVKLPVGGRVLIVPVYLARPDIAEGPIDVDVTLGGLRTGRVRFGRNGWHVLSYDLAEIAGAANWSRLRSLTLTFDVSRTVRPSDRAASTDHRDLGIGLGQPRWSARIPRDAVTPAPHQQ
jgi:hypothetical protein